MGRNEIIIMFSQKMLISDDEVEKYDEETKAVFNELVENGCIRYTHAEKHSCTTTSMKLVKEDMHIYEVLSYEIKEKYKELFI